MFEICDGGQRQGKTPRGAVVMRRVCHECRMFPALMVRRVKLGTLLGLGVCLRLSYIFVGLLLSSFRFRLGIGIRPQRLYGLAETPIVHDFRFQRRERNIQIVRDMDRGDELSEILEARRSCLQIRDGRILLCEQRAQFASQLRILR